LPHGFGRLVRMLMGGLAQKIDLLSVPATPFAE